MRKITQEIKQAFNGGYAKSTSNTCTDGTSVFLHGNKIIENRGPYITYSLAGWPTRTTIERINGIIDAGLHTVNGVVYDGAGNEIDAYEWNVLKGGE